jgi:uncharacterized protein YjiS (DUF1127 family)
MTQVILAATDALHIPAVLDFFRDLKRSYKKRQDRKETIKQLSALSNRELNDMGISRGDIWAIANGDPSYNRRKVSENDNLKGWV